MREMTARLAADDELAAAYRAAHEDYLRAAPRSPRCPRSRASPPAACRTG